MKTDLEAAREVKLRPIKDVAAGLGIAEDDIVPYGRYKAKLPLRLANPERAKKSRLILVSAITPTPAGEGKTTVSIGLSLGLNRIGKKAVVVLREPSLGPVFGVKGGATGGGRSQVLPMEDIDLHFTGDFSAIEKAHNLLAAIIDNNVQNKKNNLNLDPRTVAWRRVMDMNDRSLRKIIVGLGGTMSGVPRETGFDIVAASEVMAILCLSDNLQHLKEKLGNIFVGYTYDRKPVFARDLKVHGAMAALLKDAIMPNLVQTTEGTPAIIHGGPFANIAHGANSIIATRLGLGLCDYAVTEAGFAFELGAEKFLDIKCRYAGLSPSAAVLVATVRALKYHGGADLKELAKPDVEKVRKGLENLEKHIENMKQFRLSPVVAVNRFTGDTPEELAAVLEKCRELGVPAAVADVWGAGGAGAEELARLVVKAADCCTGFKPIYEWEWPVEKKIETIAGKMYGARHIDYTAKARKDLEKIYKLGLDKLPVCIAKTQKSLSDNPDLIGRPKDFVVTVREIEIAAGAGFLIPITGEIMRMPGLPEHPASETIDIDADGNITGLF
ncbi:MAG TPA: formate--tetrahydrofolate ligase [Elusimicrobiales bacterium]|nr:formate--tetrahydrofolate ligase [Elusimicrobiales bacterium]